MHRQYAAILLLLGTWTPILGQQMYYYAYHESVGLRSDQVNDIEQDHDGYLWISTLDGIERFDGRKGYAVGRDNGWPVTGNTFDLLVDDHNRLWVASGDTSLFIVSQMNSSRPRFTFIPEVHSPRNLVRGTNGCYWATGIHHAYRLENDRVVETIPLDNLPANVEIRQPYTDGQRLFLPTSGKGLYIWDTQAHRMQHLGKAEGLLSDLCTAVLRYGDQYWIGHYGGYSIWHRDGSLERVNLLPDEEVMSLRIDPAGRLWLCTTSGTQIMKGRKVVYRTRFWEEELISSTTDDVFFDREGNPWLCTPGGGISKAYNPFLIRFNREDVEVEPCYSIEQVHDSIYYTGYFGVPLMGKSVWNRGYYDLDTLNLEDHEATYSCRDTFQNILCFSGYYGLTTIQDGKIKSYPTPGVENWFVWFNPYDTTFYAASPLGLTALHDGKIRQIRYADGRHEYLSMGVCTRNGMYMGSENGIKKLTGNILTDAVEFDGLYGVNRDIKSVVRDPNDNVWVDLNDNRVVRFWFVNGHFHHRVYNLYDLLGITGPFHFYFHGNDAWLRTFSRLYRLDLESVYREQPLIRYSLGRNEGMAPQTSYFTNSYLDTDGTLWLMGTYGIFNFDYRLYKPNTAENINHFRSITAGHQETDVRPYCDSLDACDMPVNLRLPFYLNEVNISYLGLCYTDPQAVKYRTRLLGLHDEWSSPVSDDHITYNNLAPGYYTFELVSCNNNGVWNATPIRFSFTIRPAWHQTWWFRGLMLCCMAGLIYLGFRIRINQLKRKQKLQEKLTQDILQSQETERKRIAQELHDGVGQELSLLKITAEKQQQEQITQRVKKVIEDIRLISRNLHPHYFEKLGLSRAIEVLVEEAHQSGPIYWVHELETIDALFSASQQLMIFRMVQECVNNTLKHSQAKNAKVSIHREGAVVQIMVQDNGRGFQPDQQKLQSLGLSTIRERVKALGGEFILRSKPGQGTQYIITLPVNV